jgi:hypothetical protein
MQKTILMTRAKGYEKEFASRKRRWTVDMWKRVVFLDECTIQYNPNPTGYQIRIQEGAEIEDRNLAANYQSGWNPGRVRALTWKVHAMAESHR